MTPIMPIYTSEEIADIIGTSAKKVDDYKKKRFVTTTKDCGVDYYNFSAIETIAREELRGGRLKSIHTEEGRIVISKKSLEKLLESAKIINPYSLYLKIEDRPRSDKGQGVTGKIRYFFKPSQSLEFSYEDTFRLDQGESVYDYKQEMKRNIEATIQRDYDRAIPVELV
jgi:hypothetical protein